MNPSGKSIVLSVHAQEQCTHRGCSETEIVEAIRTAEWKPAELGRSECRKDFAFNRSWNGKDYGIKQVRPIFAEEAGQIIVITVYVYYF